MEIIKVIVSMLFGAFFIVGASFNNLVFIRQLKHEKTPSVLPLFVGIIGVISVAVWPYHNLKGLIWLPLILDYGCLPYFFIAISKVIAGFFKISRINLLSRYISENNERRVIISLFKKNICRIEQIRKRDDFYGSYIGKWTEESNILKITIDDYKLTLNVTEYEAKVIDEGSNDKIDKDLSLTNFVFKKV